MPIRSAKLLKEAAMEGHIPAVITPAELMKMLGVKCPKMLAKMPIPRCRLYEGSSRYVYLAHDVLEYLRSQRDITEIDLD
jgi:hypothetical protein